jgi:hypothetical protein
MQVYHAQDITATTIKETKNLASACVPIMDESRQLLVSTIFCVISSMLVATLCTRPAAKLLLVSRVQHVHAPARHNMCVVEKMETAAIAFHVVFHSKVKSIVVFGMHVGDTSCADCGKKMPVARVWRKHYALRNACTKCRSSRDKFVSRLGGLDRHKRVQPRLPVVQALSRFENVRCM